MQVTSAQGGVGAPIGKCIMFDQCGTDAQTGKPLNCQYEKPAPAITDDKGKRLLAELCPQFVNQTSGISTVVLQDSGLTGIR